MRRLLLVAAVLAACVPAALPVVFASSRMSPGRPTPPSPPPVKQEKEALAEIILPAPMVKSDVSIEEALRRRRSVREFAPRDLMPDQLGQLAWAAQGITDRERNLRAAPSAGALYPLRVYLLKEDGVFLYQPLGHRLLQRALDDRRPRLAKAAGDQPAVRTAGVDVVIAAAPKPVKEKYGDRADRFICLEAGHVAQNLLLQATSLGLAGVPVGAFDDRAVAGAVGLPADEVPVYIVPLGYPAVPTQ